MLTLAPLVVAAVFLILMVILVFWRDESASDTNAEN